jgi:hypothetical protein
MIPLIRPNITGSMKVNGDSALTHERLLAFRRDLDLSLVNSVRTKMGLLALETVAEENGGLAGLPLQDRISLSMASVEIGAANSSALSSAGGLDALEGHSILFGDGVDAGGSSSIIQTWIGFESFSDTKTWPESTEPGAPILSGTAITLVPTTDNASDGWLWLTRHYSRAISYESAPSVAASLYESQVRLTIREGRKIVASSGAIRSWAAWTSPSFPISNAATNGYIVGSDIDPGITGDPLEILPGGGFANPWTVPPAYSEVTLDTTAKALTLMLTNQGAREFKAKTRRLDLAVLSVR